MDNSHYKKSLKELYVVINALSEEEKNKIPKNYIKNIESNMDASYEFEYNINKSLSDQNLLLETKALIVDLYIKYFSQGNEKEKWEKYYKISYNLQEDEKREKYNNDIIFKNNNLKEDTQETVELVPIKEENFLEKVIKIIKKYINNFIN